MFASKTMKDSEERNGTFNLCCHKVERCNTQCCCTSLQLYSRDGKENKAEPNAMFAKTKITLRAIISNKKSV